MARKRPDWHQPTLFPADPDQSPEPEKPLHSNHEGDTHAVQDHRSRTPATEAGDARPTPSPVASGEKSKARDIIAAIRTLKAIEEQRRPATSEEKEKLSRFCGFGPVALSLFPDPVSGRYKDAGWQSLGEELKALLDPD